MLEKNRGIFLKQIKYTDTTSIAHIYTENSGRLSVLIRRMKGKGQKKSTLQPLYLLELQLNIKRNREIQHVTDLNVFPVYHSIPFQVVKSAIALFISDVLSLVLKEEEANRNLFYFLYNSLQLFDHMEIGISNFHLVFLYELSKYLGFYPNDNFTEKECYFNLREGCYTSSNELPEVTIDKETSLNMHFLKEKGFNLIHEINLSRFQRKRLIECLLKYYSLHLPGLGQVKSLHILNEIFNPSGGE